MNDGNGAGRQGESLKTLKPKCNTMKQKIVVFEMTGCGQNRNITHLTIKTEQHTTNNKRNKAVICWKDRNFVELAIIATTSHTYTHLFGEKLKSLPSIAILLNTALFYWHSYTIGCGKSSFAFFRVSSRFLFPTVRFHTQYYFNMFPFRPQPINLRQSAALLIASSSKAFRIQNWIAK